VDLERGECFGFLGFEFRYLRGLSGAMRPHYTPKLKKRTALVRALKEVFRRHRSQPIERVINLINPMLRGWVNYFAVGHSSECFSFIKDWVYLFSAIIHRRGVVPPSQPGSHAADTSRARSGFPRGYISPNFKVLTSNNPRSGT
jgi:hypothetical protein